MRIGTWNLEGKWTAGHLAVLSAMDCDVLLLTEVSHRTELPGYLLVRTVADMQPGRSWAAVASRIGLEPLPDPHPASAMAIVNELRVCCSILPWRRAGDYEAFTGSNVTEMTEHAVAAIALAEPDIWGGDWNHSMSGREWVGSNDGRRAILQAVDQLGLTVFTAELSSRNAGQLSIDHIAVRVPTTATVVPVERRLSDHDAYLVDTIL